MANERDFQEYAVSGEIEKITILGTGYYNEVAVRGDIPTDYITMLDLDTKALSGEYSAIYIGGTYEGNKAATQEYVDSAIITGGGYTDSNVVTLLNSGTITSMYIGVNTDPQNLVATQGYVDDSPLVYGDSDVQTLMSSGTLAEIFINKGAGAVEVATLDDLVTSGTAIPRLAENVEITALTTAVAVSHSAKNLIFNGIADQTLTILSTDFDQGFQVGLFNMTANAINITITDGTINGGASVLDQIPQYSGLFMMKAINEEWVAS